MRTIPSFLSLCTLIVLATVATATAQSVSDRPQNEIEIRGNVAVPSGELNFSGTADSGSTLDLSRDFDFKNKLGFDLRYIRRSKNDKHKILVQFSRDNWSQSAVLSRTLMFRGQTYVANLAASLDVTVRTFRGMYSYRWGNEKIRFGPMVDLGIISTNAKLTGTTNNGTRTAEGSISKFAATIGYDLDYNPFSKVNIFHNLGAIAFKGEHVFHVEGGAKYYASTHFGVMGGYRYQRYKLTNDNNLFLVRQHGPFFGGVIRF